MPTFTNFRTERRVLIGDVGVDEPPGSAPYFRLMGAGAIGLTADLKRCPSDDEVAPAPQFRRRHLLAIALRRAWRDLGDTKLYIPNGDTSYAALKPMMGREININQIRAHWDEILRLATSIKQGAVTASLMLRKLASWSSDTSSGRPSSWTGHKTWSCAACSRRPEQG